MKLIIDRQESPSGSLIIKREEQSLACAQNGTLRLGIAMQKHLNQFCAQICVPQSRGNWLTRGIKRGERVAEPPLKSP
jgi:hypothetical protein